MVAMNSDRYGAVAMLRCQCSLTGIACEPLGVQLSGIRWLLRVPEDAQYIVGNGLNPQMAELSDRDAWAALASVLLAASRFLGPVFGAGVSSHCGCSTL